VSIRQESDWNSDQNPIRMLDLNTVSEQLFRIALTQACASTTVTDLTGAAEGSGNFDESFAEAFCDTALLRTAEYVVAPDELAQIAPRAIRDLQVVLANSYLPSTGWTRWVTVPFESLIDGAFFILLSGGLDDVDGLGELPGARAAAELTHDAPGPELGVGALAGTACLHAGAVGRLL
jgi:hypothetical protein